MLHHRYAFRFATLLLAFMLLAGIAFAEPLAFVYGGRLQLRKAPEEDAAIITTLYEDTHVRVLDAENGWAEVEIADGRTGYVQQEFLYVTTVGILDNGQKYVNLREEPDLDSKVLEQYPSGTEVNLLAAEGKGWCHVEIDGITGYMSDSFIKPAPPPPFKPEIVGPLVIPTSTESPLPEDTPSATPVVESTLAPALPIASPEVTVSPTPVPTPIPTPVITPTPAPTATETVTALPNDDSAVLGQSNTPAETRQLVVDITPAPVQTQAPFVTQAPTPTADPQWLVTMAPSDSADLIDANNASQDGVDIIRPVEITPEELPINNDPLVMSQHPSQLDRVIDPDKPMIALTFDDGPGPYTLRIASIIAQNGGRATFFMVGNRVKNFRDVVAELATTGHEIASHTWSHENLTKISESEAKKQITDSTSTLDSASGQTVTLLRPPYGSANANVRNIARQFNLPLLRWSIDTEDWKTKDAEATYKAIMAGAAHGEIVLCHDLVESTIAAIEKAVPELIEQGYQLVTITELFEYGGVELKPGSIYYRLPQGEQE